MIFKKCFSHSASSVFFTCLVAFSLVAGTGCTRAKRKPKASAAKPATNKTAPEEQKSATPTATPTPVKKAEPGILVDTQVPKGAPIDASSPADKKPAPPTVLVPEEKAAPIAKSSAKNFNEWVRNLVESKAVEIDYTAVDGLVKALLEEAKDQLPAQVTLDQAAGIVMAIATKDLKEQAIQNISAALEKECGHLGIFKAEQDAAAYQFKTIDSITGSQLKSGVLALTSVLIPQMDHTQMKEAESKLVRFRVLNLAAAEQENIRFEYSFDPKKVVPSTDKKPIKTNPELKIKGLNKAFEALLIQKWGVPTVFVIQPSVLAASEKTVLTAVKILEQQAIDIQKGEGWISSTQYADDVTTAKEDLNLDETVEKMNASKQATIKGSEFKAYLEARVAEGKTADDVVKEYSASYDQLVQQYYPELSSRRAKKFYAAGVRYLIDDLKVSTQEVPGMMQSLLPGERPTPFFMYDVLNGT